MAPDVMSDEEWAFFERFILAVRARNGRKPTSHRLVLDGIFWIARTSAPWRDLPEAFGKWFSVYRKFRRWTLAGLWEEIMDALNQSGAVPFCASLEPLQDAPQNAAEGMESTAESWLPTLLTDTPEEGFDLAVSMARKALITTQTDTGILHALRPNYAHDPQSLIDVSGVVAAYFATVAEANDFWRDRRNAAHDPWAPEAVMSDISFPKATREHAERRHALTPEADDAFKAFRKAVFAEGALDTRTKQLIAVAVAHVTQCPWCIQGHVKAARREGASTEQIMETIWVAAEMRAGAAFAHSVKTLDLLDDADER